MVKRKVEDTSVVPPRRSNRRKIEDNATQEKVTPVTKSKSVKKQSQKEIPPGKVPQVKHEENQSFQRNYWLMKAEPESRLEKGHDVKFSIDDLASRTSPEPWDGIRNFAARNHIRNMKKGDLAFFYHSSCKIPSIVGTMEIVEEHTPDLSSLNPSAPYHDPRDDPSNPKWSLVHVTFREKFKYPITLTTLRELAEKKDGLEGLMMLKQTRLSVSKVEAGEWEYLMKWREEKERELNEMDRAKEKEGKGA